MKLHDDNKLLGKLVAWHEAQPPIAAALYDSAMDYIESLHPTRTDREIVDQTERLAQFFAEADDFRWYGLARESISPRTRGYWRKACMAQEFLTNTDVDNCVDILRRDEAETIIISDKWKRFVIRQHFARVAGDAVALFDELVDRPDQATQVLDKHGAWRKRGYDMLDDRDLAAVVTDMAETLQRVEDQS